jgi:hypothetical protein
MTSARSLKPLSLFQRFSALCANLNTMDNMVGIGHAKEEKNKTSNNRYGFSKLHLYNLRNNSYLIFNENDQENRACKFNCVTAIGQM